jgi:arylsulfatase
MATQSDKVQRQILPIPDSQHVGLTAYDAKDPDTPFLTLDPPTMEATR